MEGFGCSFLKNIKQKRPEDVDYWQPFAFIGEAYTGFGKGNQQVVLETSPKFGEITAIVNRVAMPDKKLGAKAKILEGDIGENKKCTLRYVNVSIHPPPAVMEEGEGKEEQ